MRWPISVCEKKESETIGWVWTRVSAHTFACTQANVHKIASGFSKAEMGVNKAEVESAAEADVLHILQKKTRVRQGPKELRWGGSVGYETREG